jgi:signal transduction histidine kinase
MDTAFVAPSSTVRTLATGDLLFVLRHGDHVIGAQVVSAPRDGEGLTQERERIAAGIAHVASMTLENARLVTQLEETSRLKTEFVSTMSHELRTPLNVILGYVEMARDTDAPMASDACIERIETSARDLLGLIEHTLEVGRIDAGCDEARMERVALGPLWRTIGSGCERLPRKPGVTLEWPDAGDVTIETDPRKLTVVVRNLVGNALKFTERGAVTADVSLVERAVVLRVHDTGIGIPPEEQATVFEMFRQVAGPDDRRGSGLGLYIVRRFVEQMGGTIELESTPGAGSTFTVTLPRPVAATSCAA